MFLDDSSASLYRRPIRLARSFSSWILSSLSIRYLNTEIYHIIPGAPPGCDLPPPVLTDDVLGVQEVQLVVLQDLLQLVIHAVDLKCTRRPYRLGLNKSWQSQLTSSAQQLSSVSVQYQLSWSCRSLFLSSLWSDLDM